MSAQTNDHRRRHQFVASDYHLGPNAQLNTQVDDYDDDEQPPRRRSRDIAGGVLLLIASAIGLFSWFGPWSRLVSSVTGASVYASLRDFPGESSLAFCIRVVLIASIGSGVAGIALLFKSYLRRAVGLIALLCAMAGIGVVCYYLIQAGFDFHDTWLGYWAFLAYGVVGLIGSMKALGTTS